MLPISLDVTGKLLLIVGGGAVGSRKAIAARTAGAIVRIVDPNIAARMHPPLDHACTLLHEAYRPEHLDGVFLAFACATPVVNEQVVADAHARGILVNSATAPHTGNVTLPSVVRSGDLSIAINTGGAAPALARRIREKLETEFDAAYANWVRLLAEVRTIALADVTDPVQRRQLLDGFADWPWLTRLRDEGIDATKAAMLAAIRA